MQSQAQPPQDVFAMLAGTTQSTVKVVDRQISSLEKTTGIATLQELIAQSETKLQEATSRKTVTQEELASMQESILLADLGTARQDLAKNRADLGEAVVGLNTFLASIGAELYTNFGNESPEEKAVVEGAQKRLSSADTEQRAAETALAVANTRTIWFGVRKRAVASATARLQKANAELEAAKLALPQAEARAKAMARERLQNADMEPLLQEYSGKAQRLVNIMLQRRADSSVEEEFVSQRRTIADSIREEAVKRLEVATAEVASLETQLTGLQNEIGLLQSGSPEYAAKETQIREASSKLEEARNRRNVAVTVSDSKTRYAEELSLHVTALQRLRGNLEAWIAALQSAAEERVATFRAVLQQQKMLDDQEVAASIDEVGAEIDKRNALSAATAVVATDRARQAMQASLPERRKVLANTIEGLLGHMRSSDSIDAEFVENFRNRYGIEIPTL